MCPVRLKCCLQISCTERILWIILIFFIFPSLLASTSFQTLPTLSCRRSEQGEGEGADPRLLGLSSSQSPVIQPKETAQHCLLLGNPTCQTLRTNPAIIHHPLVLPPEREKRPRRDPGFQLGAPELRLTCETTLTLYHLGQKASASWTQDCLVPINSFCLCVVLFPAGHKPSGPWHLPSFDMDVSELSKQWMPHPSLHMRPKWPTFPTRLHLEVLWTGCTAPISDLANACSSPQWTFFNWRCSRWFMSFQEPKSNHITRLFWGYYSWSPFQSSIQKASVSSRWRAGTPTVINESFLSGKWKTYHVSKMTANSRTLRERGMGLREWKCKEILKKERAKHMGGKSLKWSYINNCFDEVLQKLQSFRMRENHPAYSIILHLLALWAGFRNGMPRCGRGGAKSLKGKPAL